ncbi:MAG: hypothetical protein ACFCUU_00365 [Cyclobacteriaceae bacterium]
MKKIPYLLILITGLFISCSADDDANVEATWFPVKITKTDYLMSNNSKTITLEYNSQNQISKIEIKITDTGDSDFYAFEYNSNGQVTSMEQTSNRSAAIGTVVNYTFNYSEDVLVSWNTQVIENGTAAGSGFRPVTYSNPKYIILENEITLGANNNISRMLAYMSTSSGFGNHDFTIHWQTTPGVFEHVEPKIPLQLIFTVFNRLQMDFYAFSSQEISHLQLPGETIVFQTTRNTDGNISSVTTLGVTTFYAKYDYEYERRRN